jgi:glycine/D-amino acid oxidase-like deaminating enzyme
MDGPAVDVVVIGGGVQGLVILETLSAAGYGCLLVTDGDVGAGQTLHSHGFLNTGFGRFGPELATAAATIVQPALRARGVTLRDNWVVLPPPGVPAFARFPPADLPAGFAAGLQATARTLPDRSFDKRQLVEALLKGREARIIRGVVTGFRGRAPVEAVWVRPEGHGAAVVEVPTQAVVVAAGCGSKRLLQDLVGTTPQLDQIKHRVVHMVCLRAPRAALPATSIAALSLGLLLAAHDDGTQVTWYVTPMELGGPAVDAVPNDAAACPQPELLRRARSALQTLYPSLREVDGLRVGHYAGYRQDIGDQPGTRLCALIAGAGNVIAALPSGLVAPWLNAADVLALLGGLSASRGEQPLLPGGGAGVRAGRPVEDRPAFNWMSWREWSEALDQGGMRA